MELLKETVNQNIVKYKTYVQMTFDDDYIVKDTLPDVGRIICSQSNVLIDEKRVVNEALWVNGKIEFEILYKSEKMGIYPEKIEGELPFQEKINLGTESDISNISVFPKIEDFNVEIINSRKLGIRGLTGFEVRVEENQANEINIDVESEGDLQKKYKEIDFLNLENKFCDKIRINKELELPKSKENIAKIIYQYINIQNIKSDNSSGELKISGDVNICILYLDEDNKQEWYENCIEFSEDIRSIGNSENIITWERIIRCSGKANPQLDFDHEYRQFGIEIILELEVKCWSYKKMNLLEDLYSTKNEMEINRREVELKNIAKSRIDERQIIQNRDSILQICGYKTNIEVEGIKNTTNSFVVNGFLSVKILYITGSEESWAECEELQIPFEQKIDVPKYLENVEYEIETCMEHLQIDLLDSTSVDVKGNISIAVIVFEKNKYDVIENARQDEKMINEQNIPGIVGYTVRENEDLWDIAKKYRTTIELIELDNDIHAEDIIKGDKLLIVKQM